MLRALLTFQRVDALFFLQLNCLEFLLDLGHPLFLGNEVLPGLLQVHGQFLDLVEFVFVQNLIQSLYLSILVLVVLPLFVLGKFIDLLVETQVEDFQVFDLLKTQLLVSLEFEILDVGHVPQAGLDVGLDFLEFVLVLNASRVSSEELPVPAAVFLLVFLTHQFADLLLYPLFLVNGLLLEVDLVTDQQCDQHHEH